MKKIAIIILIAVLTLGALGTAYAAWGQNLFINGTVTSGNYAVSFQSVTPPTTANDTLAGLTAVITKTSVAADTVTITINNAFPNYTVAIPYVVQNTGTVPLNVGLSVLASPPTWLAVVNSAPVGPVSAVSGTGSGTIKFTCSDSTPTNSGAQTFSYQLASTQSVP